MEEYRIANGPQDKPFLFLNPTAQGIVDYDIHDKDGGQYMLDHDFEGCISFPFSKKMVSGSGYVALDGENIPYFVKRTVMVVELDVLGIPLRRHLRQYGQEKKLEIGGFQDIDGNVMDTVQLTVRTNPRILPRKEYVSHEAVALRAAEEGIVLMENRENVLPLSSGQTLNVFGKALYDFRVCAVGAGKINPRYVVEFRDAVEQSEDFTLNTDLEQFYLCDEDRIPPDETLQKARSLSDVGIVMLSRSCGENMDNSNVPGEYRLTVEEETLICKVCEVFPKRVVILNVGYPIAMDFVERYGIQSVVYCGFGGMLAGEALLNILSGKGNPSGKLPDTWVESYEELPAAKNFYDCCGDNSRRYCADSGKWIDTVYEEGIYVGYRYFQGFGRRAKYPFGHGLSYTSFSFQTEKCTYDSEKGISLTVRVANTGKRPGREVVQVYLQKPEGKLEQPPKILIGFDKTGELLPGEEQLLTLQMGRSRFTSYDETAGAYVIEQGNYDIYVGNSSENNILVYHFSLEGNVIVKKVANRMQPVMPIEELSRRKGGRSTISGEGTAVKDTECLEPKRERKDGAYGFRFDWDRIPGRKGLTFGEVMDGKADLDEYVAGLDIGTLARLAVCAGDGWGMEGTGEAGRLAQTCDSTIPRMVVADGNSGVNLKKRNIGMPSGVTLCASFDRELIAQVGKVIGEEARELGIDLILAPAFNIHRNPLCGRQPEYFSEDPCLAGLMAASFCSGLESTGVGGCYKHFIANNAESSRKRNQSIMSERALREIYAKAFEIAMEEYEPVSMMTAYNAVNGLHTSADADLILGILREEWQFEGFVMTDWGSYDSVDPVEMESAGNTWITPGGSDSRYPVMLEKAVQEGRLDIKRLRDNIWYLLHGLLRMRQLRQEHIEGGR